MKEINTKVLIIGAGRMGISHGIILASILGVKNIFFYDNSFISRFLARVLGFNIHLNENCNEFSSIIVCTPTGSHVQTLKMINHKNLENVFIEKPLTDGTNIYEAEKIFKTSVARFQIGYVYRFMSSFQLVRKIINEERFGKIIRFSASINANVVTNKDERTWRNFKDNGGGVINDFGSHLIDTIFFLFGRNFKISDIKRKIIFSHDVEDYVFAKLFFEKFDGDISLNWSSKDVRKATNEIVIDFERMKVKVSNAQIFFLEDDKWIGQELKFNSLFYLRGEEFTNQIEHFINKDDSICANFQSSIEVDKVLIDLKNSELING